MVLCSINGLFLFIQRAFKFFFFEHKCTFFEFILLPCQIILKVASPTKEKFTNVHGWEKNVYGYGNCFSCIVYAFWTETQLSRKI